MSLERLELDVALKLAFVENSLTKVEDYRQQLQENAQKVKEEIHEVVERQVGSLRVRERQLVRQVEVVTAHQTCLLGTQQAGLMHGKGALVATRDLLQRCSSTDASTLAKIKVDDMECLKNIQPVNHVSVQLDETALSSAVSKFGSVQLPDTITHHPSPVIPAKVEEYEDDEHDVLHKSVAGAASGPDSPVRITVQFPRLANQNWLAQHRERGSSQTVSSKASGGVSKQAKSQDITSWLSGLQLAGAQEDEDDVPTRSSAGSFDMVAMDSPIRTSDSSSIEIVPSRYDSEKDDCSTPGSAMCEIENLHVYVSDKSRWLSDKRTCRGSPPFPLFNIDSICQANETCSSFDDCLCRTNCKETALEKLQQSTNFRTKTNRKRTLSESEGSRPILAHMASILASENSQWLLEKQNHNLALPVPVKRAMYEAPVCKWLRLSPQMHVTQPPRVKLATHSNIWLLNKFKSQKEKNIQEKDENEREKCTNEKESRITTEALSDALRKVNVSTSSDTVGRGFPLGNTSPTAVGKLSLSSSGHPWLLSKNLSSSQQVRDNKLEEMEIINKKQWLSCSSESSPVTKKCGTMTPPPLPESVLSVAHAGINNWLMKSCY